MTGSGIFPTDDWQLVQGDMPSGPMFLRFRTGEPSEADRKRFDTLVKVRWSYQPRDNSGLPSSDLLAEMDAFEEAVLDASDRDADWGSCVVVMTFGGTREWRFYTPDVDGFQGKFSESLRGLGPYPLQFETFEDPDWTGIEEIRAVANR